MVPSSLTNEGRYLATFYIFFLMTKAEDKSLGLYRYFGSILSS